MRFVLTSDGVAGLLDGSIPVSHECIWCTSIRIERDGDHFYLRFVYDGKIVCELNESFVIDDGAVVEVASDIEYPIKVNFKT